MTEYRLHLVFLGSFCASVLLLPTASRVEARGRRTCCVPVCAAPPATTQSIAVHPTESELICPMYKWMTYASYCSYYAVGYNSCHPQSYDSSDCGLSAAGCSPGPSTGCMPGVLHLSDPGLHGYGLLGSAPKAAKVTDSQLPGSDRTKLAVTLLLKKVIKFNGPANSTIHAQVFVARVVTRQALVQNPSATGVLVSRGMEITEVPLEPGDLDLTSPQSGAPTIAPTPGLPFTYMLQIHDPAMGIVRIPVVMHHSTPTNSP